MKRIKGKRRFSQENRRFPLALRVGFEPSWDHSQTDFESFNLLIKTGRFRAGFGSFRLRRKPHKIRLFRPESLAVTAFFQDGFKSAFLPILERNQERQERNKERRQYKNSHRRKDFKPTKSIFEVLEMNDFSVNWDSVPDVLTKDQFYQLCHISKSTALYLLRSGKVPCEWTGKKTRCYKIKKEEVKTYLEKRGVFPEL